MSLGPQIHRLLLVVAALALGFSLGWVTHARTEGPAARPVQIAASGPAIATSAGVLPASLMAPPPPADTRAEHRARIETLRWLRESGTPMFFQAFQGDDFNPLLGKLLGLNETEMIRLAQAAQGAKTQLEAARAATATSRVAADGTLVVEIPALDVVASGAIYDQLHNTFESTLGSDRLETFNELAGEAFERSFDRFGLNAVRYEISQPSPAPDNSQTVFLPYKRSFVDATGSSTGSSTSQLRLGEIEKYDGLLAKILPPSLKAQPGHP